MSDAARLQQLAARLLARAHPPPPPGLVEFVIGGARVGDAQPAVAQFIAQQISGFALKGARLLMLDDTLDVAARTELLARVARKLQEARLIVGWRDEVLSVGNPALASLERAACRALGITTEAVHLNAYVDARSMLVARRAALKQIDPGQWDNLVGGMVAAHETLHDALSREAIEEAGLRIDGAALQKGRWFQMRRSVPEGVQSEIIHVYDTTLAADIRLQNQDGEVDAIECRPVDDVIAAIERDEFTLEASLVVVESLTRRGGIDAPAGLFH
ncbi:MAG: DUF4743 domain-containing protein [Burkholderiaceae bacterium]